MGLRQGLRLSLVCTGRVVGRASFDGRDGSWARQTSAAVFPYGSARPSQIALSFQEHELAKRHPGHVVGGCFMMWSLGDSSQQGFEVYSVVALEGA